jgi:hypothetical protein
MPSGITHVLLFLFVHLGIILIFVLGFYSGLSDRVRTIYLFDVRVVSLLSSRFAASELVWFSNFLNYLVFHCPITVAEPSKACTVFVGSEAGTVGSNPTQSMGVWRLCVYVRFSVFVYR